MEHADSFMKKQWRWRRNEFINQLIIEWIQINNNSGLGRITIASNRHSDRSMTNHLSGSFRIDLLCVKWDELQPQHSQSMNRMNCGFTIIWITCPKAYTNTAQHPPPLKTVKFHSARELNSLKAIILRCGAGNQKSMKTRWVCNCSISG